MALPVDVISAPGTAPSSDAAQGSSKMGKNEFLKLLMAQLAHQDPTSPSDSSAFVAQLAQFANLEQMQASNERLDALLMAQAASNQTGVANLVGKDVLHRTNNVSLTEGAGAAVTGKLAAEAANVTAVITDASGKVVRTLHLDSRAAGVVNMTWDGRDESGLALPTGDYQVKLTASDTAGNAIDIEPHSRARVTGVSFANGYPELLVAGTRVKLSDVIEINESTTPILDPQLSNRS